MRPFWLPAVCKLFLFALLLTVCNFGRAEQISAKHAKIELISQQDGIAPGGAALLGVHFTLEPGWHIYWINPGDSGQPPEFRWQLPQGFTAGEIEWPHPERLQSKPELADYGYHDGVLLMVPLHAPQATPEKTAEIAVQAKWLVCREVCLPDRAQLHLTLPVKTAPLPDPATALVFDAAEKLVPLPLPPNLHVSAISRGETFVLAVKISSRVPNRVRPMEFFPLDPGQVDNAAAQKVAPTADGLTLTLKKSELLLKPISLLRGVLVLNRIAYRVEAKVTSP